MKTKCPRHVERVTLHREFLVHSILFSQMGLFVPVVDPEKARCERDAREEAKHRAFHEPHSLHRGNQERVVGPRDTAAQEAVHGGDVALFQPSATWRGRRPGYVFTRRQHGQGYYLEDREAARRARESALVTGAAQTRRSRSRSRSPRRVAEKPEFDPRKLSAPLARRPSEQSAEERQAAALARLAEQRRNQRR